MADFMPLCLSLCHLLGCLAARWTQSSYSKKTIEGRGSGVEVNPAPLKSNAVDNTGQVSLERGSQMGRSL